MLDTSSFGVAPEQHPEEGYVGNLNVIDVESELCSPVRRLPGLGDLGRMRSLDDKMPELGNDLSSLGKSFGEFGSQPAFSELNISKGHPGIGELGPPRNFNELGGHPGIGSLGQIGGHPGIGELGPPRGFGSHPAIGELGAPKGHPGIGQIGPSLGRPGIGQLGPGRGHPGIGMPPPSWNPSDDIRMDEPGVIRVKTVGVLEAPSLSGDQSRPLALAMPLGSVPGHGEDPTMLYRHEIANREENVADGMSERDAQREMSELEFALQNLNPSEVERRRKLFHQQQYR
jgi:hypothetical protein